MAKSRKITNAEQTDDQRRIAELEAKIAELTSKHTGKEPGLYDLGGDEYCDAKFERVLPGDGGSVVWVVKGDWVDCQPNLRFHKGRPIPGFGGKEIRWIGGDGKSGLLAYFRGKEFAADLVSVLKLARVKAKAKA